MGFWKSSYDKFKGIDMFSHKFTLNYNQKKKYPTLAGTIVSIVITAICVFYGVNLFTKMINRSKIMTNSGITGTTSLKDPLSTNINDDGIYLAFSWMGGTDHDIDIIGEGLGQLALYTFTTSLDEDNILKTPRTIISYEIEKCNSTTFPFDKERLDEYFSLSKQQKYYCFKNKDMFKIVHQHHTLGESLSFAVYGVLCPNGNCNQTKFAEVRDYQSTIFMSAINQYYDASDPQNPVKTEIDDHHFVQLSKGDSSLYQVDILRSQYEIEDWHSIITGENSGEFLSLTYGSSAISKNKFNATDGVFIFDVQDRIRFYNTNVISFLEVFGQIGGVYEILYLAFTLILRRLSGFYLKRDIKNIEKQTRDEEGWFSYPSSLKGNTQKQKKRRVQDDPLSFFSFSVTKNGRSGAQNYDNVLDRSSVYKDEETPIEKLPNLEEMKKMIKVHCELKHELDVVSISQSLRELKLYVSLLMEKYKEDENCHVETTQKNSQKIMKNISSQLDPNYPEGKIPANIFKEDPKENSSKDEEEKDDDSGNKNSHHVSLSPPNFYTLKLSNDNWGNNLYCSSVVTRKSNK
ncbi:unnamed protein product [Moneuplotes crassus]|uniref:Uncharacterized protein n=1 Tax=Euplotes crassus TaxID=5936 RepID=A0AAD1U836_EUPCR|nr:unnamed protein product [Moneuplotes crassus]